MTSRDVCYTSVDCSFREQRSVNRACMELCYLWEIALSVIESRKLGFGRRRYGRLYSFRCSTGLQSYRRSMNFYARKQNASRVFAIVWASVRLSVRLSVTLVICIKTVQARITKFLLWAAPRSLVYQYKVSCRGSPRTRASKRGTPLKKTSFCRYWLE